MRFTTSNPKRMIAGLATVVLVGLPLAACGTDSESSSSSSSSSKSAPAPKAVASIDELTGETTAIKLDKGFTDALTSLKLTPGVVGERQARRRIAHLPDHRRQRLGPSSPARCPTTSSARSSTKARASRSSAGGTKVELTNLNVDPGVSRVYGDVSVNGKTAVTSAYLFKLNGSTLEPLKTEGSNAVLEGTQVQISEVAAPLLNDTFKTDAVKPGLLVGIAKITVATQ